MLFKKFILLSVITLNITVFSGQKIQQDSLPEIQQTKESFNYKTIIAPGVLITYGIIGTQLKPLQNLDENIRRQVNENDHQKTGIDDFMTVLPAAGVYILNVAGVKGKNNIRDRSIILGTSYLVMGTTVTLLKNAVKRERPDQSTLDSFPSGHTATAFASAEFLWQEYKDVSVWYGVSGYMMASATGVLRMYNNRHWFTDVAMGAGIGILSTKVAYWVYPFLNRHVFKFKDQNTSALVLPFYNGAQLGVGMVVHFK